MRTVLLFVVIISIPFFAQAQHLGSSKGKVALGLGFGLPYGGFGGRVSVNPGIR